MPIFTPTIETDDAGKVSLAPYPCLNGISEKELLYVIAYNLCLIVHREWGDPFNCIQSEMVKAAACFKCFSKKQKLQIAASMIMQWMSANDMEPKTCVNNSIWRDCQPCSTEAENLDMILAMLKTGIENGSILYSLNELS